MHGDEAVRVRRADVAGGVLCVHGTTSSYVVDPVGECVWAWSWPEGRRSDAAQSATSSAPETSARGIPRRIVSPLSIGGTATVLARAPRPAHRPFGHRWNLAQRLRDVPHDELVDAAARAFGGG